MMNKSLALPLAPSLVCAALLPFWAQPALAAGGEAPGLVSARLVEGGQSADGARIVALDLLLEPGWKTYWRSPGSVGIAPQFDWGGTEAVALWPLPERITSGADETLGYHDRLTLPFRIEGEATALTLRADLGLCEDICVPVHLELTLAADAAPPASGSPEQAALAAALARQAAPSLVQPQCSLTEIEDGARVEVTLDPTQGEWAAIEPLDSDIWVEPGEIQRQGDTLRVSADLIAPNGAPFLPEASTLRITQFGDAAGREMTGCVTD